MFNVLSSEKSREGSVPIYKHEEHNSSTEIRLCVFFSVQYINLHVKCNTSLPPVTMVYQIVVGEIAEVR